MSEVVRYEVEKTKGLYSYIVEVYEDGMKTKYLSGDNEKVERAVELMNLGLFLEGLKCGESYTVEKVKVVVKVGTDEV